MLFPRHIRKLSYASTIRGNECLCLIQGLFSPLNIFLSGPYAKPNADRCNFRVARHPSSSYTRPSVEWLRIAVCCWVDHRSFSCACRRNEPGSPGWRGDYRA